MNILLMTRIPRGSAGLVVSRVPPGAGNNARAGQRCGEAVRHYMGSGFSLKSDKEPGISWISGKSSIRKNLFVRPRNQDIAPARRRRMNETTSAASIPMMKASVTYQGPSCHAG